MSRYASIIKDDVVNGEGVCTSFWVQGCPLQCIGCHNQDLWDFNGGIEYTDHTRWEIIKLISANDIVRNFSILGGEPLATQNVPMVWEVVTTIRHAYPNIKIFLWTGFTFEQIIETKYYGAVKEILDAVDVLIDGPYIEELRDLSLKFRGSSNQRVWIKKDGEWIDGKHNC